MAEDKMQKKVRVTNAKDGKTSYVTYQDLVNGVYANLSHIGIRNLASNTDTIRHIQNIRKIRSSPILATPPTMRSSCEI